MFRMPGEAAANGPGNRRLGQRGLSVRDARVNSPRPPWKIFGGPKLFPT